MKTIMKALLLTSAISFTAPAWAADTAATPTNMEQMTPEQRHDAWKKMTPEQKKAQRQAMKEKLAKMTPEERKVFHEKRQKEWQARYDKATPEEQAKMKERKDKREAWMKRNHKGPYKQDKANGAPSPDSADSTDDTSGK